MPAEPAVFEPGSLEAVIASRLREYRQSAGISLSELASLSGLSKPFLSKIENANTSCSLSTLSRLASTLQIPVTALFRGIDTEAEAVFTPAGQGAAIVRRGSNLGHHYQMLGVLRGEHKRLEPQLVTLTEASEVFPQFQHAGTEFLYMLDGAMAYSHGQASYEMVPGDSLVFDGGSPHGPARLITLPIRFLSVIGFGTPPVT